jgi:hypothetical protein
MHIFTGDFNCAELFGVKGLMIYVKMLSVAQALWHHKVGQLNWTGQEVVASFEASS